MKQLQKDYKVLGLFILASVLVAGLLTAFILLGAKTYGACVITCEKPLKINLSDYQLAKMGYFRNGDMSTKGALPVRVSESIEQANRVNLDNNFNPQ